MCFKATEKSTSLRWGLSLDLSKTFLLLNSKTSGCGDPTILLAFPRTEKLETLGLSSKITRSLLPLDI